MSNTDPMPSLPATILAQLAADFAEDFAPRPPQSRSDSTPRLTQLRERRSPIRDRLQAALASLPVELAQDGLTWDQITPLVMGRRGGRPSTKELSAALRALGWTRVRLWSVDPPSAMVWYPPNSEAAALLGRKGGEA